MGHFPYTGEGHGVPPQTILYRHSIAFDVLTNKSPYVEGVLNTKYGRMRQGAVSDCTLFC